MSCLRSLPPFARTALLLVLLFQMTGSLLFAGPLFPNPRYRIGDPSLAIFQGDFNGDQRVDLVITDFEHEYYQYPDEGEVWVYLGDGDGYLKVTARLPVGHSPYGAAALDLDRDGDDDLVVANFYSSDLSILISRGDGTFEPERRMTVGFQPIWLCAGRLDADQDPDLLVVEQGASSIHLLRGSGSGDLVEGGSFPAGLYPTGCVLADFDSDGLPDLAVSNAGSDNVSVFRGGGDGTFGTAVLYAAGDSPESIAAADFDLDGLMDLATGNSGSENVSILLGQGFGSFAPGDPVDVGFAGYSLAAGDTDGDGAPDLAVATPGLFEPERVELRAALLRGHGDGSFDSPMSTQQFGAVSFQQLDDDPAQELAVSAVSDLNGMTLLAIEGADHASPPRPPVESSVGLRPDPSALSTADFDGDGTLDLAVVAALEEAGTAIKSLLGLGDGHFTVADSIALPDGYDHFLGVGDLNGDGRPDMVAGEAILDGDTGEYIARSQVLLGSGNGRFILIEGPESPGPLSGMTLGDLNNDGLLDLISSYGAIPFDGDGQIGVRLGHGNGTFGTEQRIVAGRVPTSLQTGDFDSDGNLDLVVANAYTGPVFLGGASYFKGNGDGTLAADQRFFLGGAAYSLLAGDVDGDGDLDLVAGDSLLRLESGSFGLEAGIVLFGDGAGHFTEGELFNLDGFMGAQMLGDFDADGDLDLVGQSDHNVRIYLNDGLGSFAAPPRHFENLTYGPLAGGDFDGDGRLDLATGTVKVLLNNGPFPSIAPQAHAQAPGTVECSAAGGTPVMLDGTASTGSIDRYEWFLDFGLPGQTLLGEGSVLSVDLPLGEHDITLKVTGPTGLTGTDELLVEVADTTPPSLTVEATPALLWPPNGAYHDVHVTATAQDACGPASIVLVSVTSSEPDDDAIRNADIGTADFDVSLQADKKGSTRVYTLLYRAIDGSGQTTQAAATVEVSKKRTSR